MLTSLLSTTMVLPPPRQARTPGIHLSSIIRAIALESGYLKAEWAESVEEISLSDHRIIDDPLAITRIGIGLAWEEWYIGTQLPDVADHPGELVLDDIYMTPDGLSVERVDGRYIEAVHEVKATYKSLKTLAPQRVTRNPKDPQDLATQWMWQAQVKGYCKARDTTRAYLHVLLLCGDYTFPLRPTPLCWQLDFTPAELDDNWSLIRDYRDAYLLRKE